MSEQFTDCLLFKILNIVRKVFSLFIFRIDFVRSIFHSTENSKPHFFREESPKCIGRGTQKLVTELILWFIRVQMNVDTSPHPEWHSRRNDIRHSKTLHIQIYLNYCAQFRVLRFKCHLILRNILRTKGNGCGKSPTINVKHNIAGLKVFDKHLPETRPITLNLPKLLSLYLDNDPAEFTLREHELATQRYVTE